ncbi:MAG: CPBP family intramembrane metalloprotease [Granulosicoccus sp.]|nr:CPBP family intramembrane metalloprotease [Granulosicoccus sp.]
MESGGFGLKRHLYLVPQYMHYQEYHEFTLKAKEARERIESTLFFAAIIIVLCISKSADYWALINSESIDVYSNTFVWIYTAAVCTPVLAYLLWLKRPLSEFGVTLHNWKQAVTESVSISLIILLLGLFALILIGKSEGKSLADFIRTDWLRIGAVAYIPHSIIQEFVFRGILLTTLIHLFRWHSLWLPLLISNLLYSFMHIHLGINAVALTLLFGYLLSWLYLRHKNIVGVSLAHMLLGSPAFLLGVL